MNHKLSTLEGNIYKLKVGEIVKLRPGFFQPTLSVVYAGILNDSTYSIAVIASIGNNSYSYNLYLPKNQTDIVLSKGKIKVIDFSSQDIQFRYYKE